MKKHLSLLPTAFALIICLFTSVNAQRVLGVRGSSSGGPLMPEQAAYDVTSYDLNLKIDPEAQTIKGALTVQARILNALDWFVMDLDPPLVVDSVNLVNAAGKSLDSLRFERREGKLWMAFPKPKKAGEEVRIRIAYGGKPRVAPRPPWVGGFAWSKTKSGEHWFTVTCQNDGADIWFPVKDHPSDKPETTDLHYTVPQPLIAVANGRLQSVVKNDDGTQTFNWHISQPINNYSITLNVAPYKTIEDKYTSLAGGEMPVTFWVLPEDYEKGFELVKQTKLYLRFLEEYLGPYPFRAEKVGIVHTNHLGMEHQTIIAYGSIFKLNEYGFDWLMLHELGHEWWANLVTASDWRDFWIHEGFQSFMDTLYLERVSGKEAYLKSMASRAKNLRNKQPVAPRESRTTVQMYMAAPDYVSSDGDIYNKGAVVLHTLRYLIGEQAFFKSLRRMAYPDPRMEKVTNGKQVHFATTDDFLHIAEKESGADLDWFFEVYLRQPKLPKLITEKGINQITLHWESPNGLPFPMPVEVQVGDKTNRYEMVNGSVSIPVAADQKVLVDPQGLVLKEQ
jgi:aminopeptidase N